MKLDYRWAVLLVVLAVVACGGESAYEEPPTEAAEQESAPEAAATDPVARHHEDEAIAHLFEASDDAALADSVTDFLSQAFGGDVEYTGRDMVSTHEGMGLTDDYFLEAGADVQAALEAAGVGADEIQVQTPSRFPTHDLSPNATAFPPQAQAGSNPT